MSRRERNIKIALVQFDAIPEEPARNVNKMIELVRRASSNGARWIMFHEGTICDYTPRLREFAEKVPEGKATRRMMHIARMMRCFISFGLSEEYRGNYYISQVFVGPYGFIYRYRKTWLWREPSDAGYRNEWCRYDPGDGPELFTIDGIKATCFICADGEAPRCLERAKIIKPHVVFYPNNRALLPDHKTFGERAKYIGAPMLVTNRTGKSWIHDCQGGCVVYDAKGNILAAANREGKEEILYCDLTF